MVSISPPGRAKVTSGWKNEDEFTVNRRSHAPNTISEASGRVNVWLRLPGPKMLPSLIIVAPKVPVRTKSGLLVTGTNPVVVQLGAKVPFSKPGFTSRFITPAEAGAGASVTALTSPTTAVTAIIRVALSI